MNKKDLMDLFAILRFECIFSHVFTLLIIHSYLFVLFFTGTRTTSSISSSAATSSNTTGGLNKMRTCVGCGGQIHDQFILQVAPNLEWHAACLKCSQCHKFLDEKCTCFVRDGKCFVYIMTMQSATYILTH